MLNETTLAMDELDQSSSSTPPGATSSTHRRRSAPVGGGGGGGGALIDSPGSCMSSGYCSDEASSSGGHDGLFFGRRDCWMMSGDDPVDSPVLLRGSPSPFDPADAADDTPPTGIRFSPHVFMFCVRLLMGGSVAEWSACWIQAQKARVQIAVATLSGNSRRHCANGCRQTAHTHCEQSPSSKIGSSPLKGCGG